MIVIRSVREVARLAYDYLTDILPQPRVAGRMGDKLKYYPTVTREPSATRAASPT